jgi:hypothetical protein
MTEEFRGAVKKALQQAQAPKSVPQLRKELAVSFRISSKDLAVLLHDMTASGEIFSWPQNRFWCREPRTILPDLVLTFMAKFHVLAASRIRTSLKLPLEMVEGALKEMVGRGSLYRWQPGRVPYFCLSEPRTTALEAILNALAAGPMSEKELIAQVRKRLPGYQGKDLREHLSGSRQVYEYPKYGKIKTRYGLKPPEPEPYLGKAIQEINAVQRLLRPYRVSIEAIHAALSRELGLRGDTLASSGQRPQAEEASYDPEALILKGITRLQPPGQGRALVSIRELRHSAGMAKSLFDKAVLSLALRGKVALHHHDFPSSLSPEEREELVRDEQGTYFVGIVPKDMS